MPCWCSVVDRVCTMDIVETRSGNGKSRARESYDETDEMVAKALFPIWFGGDIFYSFSDSSFALIFICVLALLIPVLGRTQID